MRSPFVWGQGGQKLTPEQVDRQREVALALMGRGADFSPATGGWAEALGRGFNGWASGRLNNLAGQAEQAGMAGAADLVAPYLGGAQGAANAPIPGMGPSGGVTTGASADALRAGLIARGLPEHIADGFVMNFQDESGLNPGINEAAPLVPGSRGGFGLYQLTGGRRTGYEDFARQRGVDPSNVDAQLDWLMYELGGPEAKAWNAISATSTPGEAGAAIVNEFLRPADDHKARRTAAYLGGGSYSPVASALMSGPSSAELTALMSDPWVARQYGPVIEALAGQAGNRENAIFQQQLAMQDPMYQAQLAKLTAGPGPNEYDQRAAAAAQFGILPDDPRYQAFVLGGALGDGGDAFTLSPGEVRFDAQGNQIATGGTAPGFTMIPPDQAAQMGLPAGQAYQIGSDGKISAIGGNGVTTNVNVGGGESKFAETLGADAAKLVGGVYEAGLSAQRNLPRIDQLEELLSLAPSGMAGRAAQVAGEWGLSLDGTDAVQAAQAMINSLVPEQRQPGSGPMSDADLELFKQSLPRIINQPGGNAKIISTMRAIAEYDAAGAEIASRAMLPQSDPNYLSQSQVMAALRERKNPLSGIKSEAPAASTPAASGWKSSGGISIRRVD